MHPCPWIVRALAPGQAAPLVVELRVTAAFAGGFGWAWMSHNRRFPVAALAARRPVPLLLYLAGKPSVYLFLGALAGAAGHALALQSLGALSGALPGAARLPGACLRLFDPSRIIENT